MLQVDVVTTRLLTLLTLVTLVTLCRLPSGNLLHSSPAYVSWPLQSLQSFITLEVASTVSAEVLACHSTVVDRSRLAGVACHPSSSTPSTSSTPSPPPSLYPLFHLYLLYHFPTVHLPLII